MCAVNRCQVLVRFLRAPSANLGFQPLHSPAGFRTAMGKKVRLAAAMSSVGVRPVYVASYGRERAVVKMSSQADHDREVRAVMHCLPASVSHPAVSRLVKAWCAWRIDVVLACPVEIIPTIL